MFSQNLSKTSGICEAWSAMLTAEWQYLIDANICQHSTIQMFGETGVLSLEPARLGQQHLQQDDNLRLTQIYVSTQQLMYCMENMPEVCNLRGLVSNAYNRMTISDWANICQQHSTIQRFGEYGFLSSIRLSQQCLQQEENLWLMQIYVSTKQFKCMAGDSKSGIHKVSNAYSRITG